MSKRSKRKHSRHVSRHHIVPRSRGGDSSLENIAQIDLRDHKNYHALFVNQIPEEIVETLVNKYWNGNWSYVETVYRRNNGHNN